MQTEICEKSTVRCRGIIVHDGKLLVVRHAPDGEYFALPGGHLEWGENILDVIKREIIEELGIPPQIGRLLYVNNYTAPFYQTLLDLFKIQKGVFIFT